MKMRTELKVQGKRIVVELERDGVVHVRKERAKSGYSIPVDRLFAFLQERHARGLTGPRASVDGRRLYPVEHRGPNARPVLHAGIDQLTATVHYHPYCRKWQWAVVVLGFERPVLCDGWARSEAEAQSRVQEFMLRVPSVYEVRPDPARATEDEVKILTGNGAAAAM